MTVASDGTLLRWIAEGEHFSRVQPIQVQPASIDLTLDDRFQRRWPWQRDWRLYTPLQRGTCQTRPFKVWPHEFLLANVKEYIYLDNQWAVFVSGKSTVGRTGLQIHNAGWVDPGFEGQLTLELYNETWWPITIYPGMPICQVVYFQLDAPSIRSYGERGRYQRQSGPTPARPPRSLTEGDLWTLT